MPFGFAAVAAPIAGGLISGAAAKSAAKTQANAANQATATELGMFNQTAAREQPFVSGGTNALNQLQALLASGSPILSMLGIGPSGGGSGAINPSTFQGSPGFQWQLQQGTNAVNNAATTTGFGGNTLKALTNYGQGLANQDWYNYLNSLNSGWNSLTGSLQNLTNTGANAAANTGSFGTTVAGQVGSNTIGAGNAVAAGQIGQANALTGGLNSIIQNMMLLGAGGGAGGAGQFSFGNAFPLANQWIGSGTAYNPSGTSISSGGSGGYFGGPPP